MFYSLVSVISTISLAPPITATDHVMETPSTTSLCYQYIVSNGILAGALTVALVIIVTLVVIVALLIVKIKKIK